MNIEGSDDNVVIENSNTPVEEVPEVEQAPEGTEEAETSEKPEEPQDKEPRKPGRRERQRQREFEQVLQEKAKLEQELQRFKSGTKDQVTEEPKIEDYDDVIAWSKAQAKWEAKQELNAYKAEQEQAQEQQYLQKQVAEHEAREEAFQQQFPDYEEKVTALVQSGLITPEVQKAVVSSDMSERIAYHLTQFPSDALQLAQIGQSGNKQAMRQAIATIEDFIESNPQVAAVKQTKATSPISPVKSNSGSTTPDPTKMSLREFEKWAPLKK